MELLIAEAEVVCFKLISGTILALVIIGVVVDVDNVFGVFVVDVVVLAAVFVAVVPVFVVEVVFAATAVVFVD